MTHKLNNSTTGLQTNNDANDSQTGQSRKWIPKLNNSGNRPQSRQWSECLIE